jgi:UDP-N-acetylmuramyl pentapeptide phosphotransferase/UDP-N-acetylglucosamine-1-phosphate transferase
VEFLEDYIPLLSLITAFIITYLSVPAIVRLSLVKKLYDEPDERKLHGRRITALGGIAIFAGIFFAFVFYTAHLPNPALNSIILAMAILFVTGIKDDLYPMVPFKKFIGQLAAILIVAIQGNVRIVDLYDLYHLYEEMPYWISIGLTVVFFVVIINSFNFIDGINGLLSSIVLVICGIYAYFFFRMETPLFLILAMSICGALLAFLRYNMFNARVFMGDSGSLVLGFLVAVLTIYFIQRANEYEPNIFYNIHGMVFAFSVLIIPIFDSIRVVFIRVFIKRKSPFSADRNHIHHALLDIGMSHVQATLTLTAANILIVIISWLLNESDVLAKEQLVIVCLIAFGLSQIPFLIKKRKKKKMA